jgi:uncharacterized protein (DUF2267 family)
MGYEEFLSVVEQWGGGLDRETAERATSATLRTLADRLAPDEARRLAAQLPAEVYGFLWTTVDAERLDVDAFLQRVAEREGVDLPTAEEHARAVFAAVRRGVDADELEKLAATLPEGIRWLLYDLPELPAPTFVHRVQERTGLDATRASRAIEAVLETLGERIAAGEVADLLARLPVELHEPLRRGAAASPAARRMSLEQFLRAVAEREGTAPDVARRHSHAVLATLRDAVGEEFYDVSVELPPEYGVLYR